MHRKILSFIMVPAVQRELDTFNEMVWNQRIRALQKDTVLPDGVPHHIHNFLQKYGLEECGNRRSCLHWFTFRILPLFKVIYGIIMMFQQPNHVESYKDNICTMQTMEIFSIGIIILPWKQ